MRETLHLFSFAGLFVKGEHGLTKSYGSKTMEYILEDQSKGTRELAIHFYSVMRDIKVTHARFH